MFPSDPVEFLFSLEKLGMKFGLDTIRLLCETLGHPERTFESILVGGTNGKGSVTVMVATALQAAGYRAGRYTSPHLERLEERFVVNGEEIRAHELRAAAGRVKAVVESLLEDRRLEAPPTFFECTTAVAFEAFSRSGVRIAVLEVGLGGRLDSTNVVTPRLAAITSIGLDHQAQLGDTLEAIAREKAGIVKAGVPVVLGRLPAVARGVIEEVAREQGAPAIHASAAAVLDVISEDDVTTVDVRTPRRYLPAVRLALRGRHQVENASVAVAILEQLEPLGWRLGDAAIRAGLEAARWPARLELMRYAGREVLVDAAHNPDGAAALADYLGRSGWTTVTLVVGVMHDKDAANILSPLLPFCARLICTTPQTPRAMPAAALAELARTLPGLRARVETVDPPVAAVARAAASDEPIVVAGSIFLVGPLRGILR